MTENSFSQEEANQFIIDCHADLETVNRKVRFSNGPRATSFHSIVSRFRLYC